MNTGRSSLLEKYFAVWAFAMPVTSVLILPSVQGTTAGYLLCFLSFPVALACAGRNRSRYTGFLLTAFFVWAIMFLSSQLANALAPFEPNFTKVAMVDETDLWTSILRKSLFTQSVYLFAVVLLCAYIYVFFKPSWEKWLLASATVLALYGMYEFFYFVVTGRPGDFLTNRAFGADFQHSEGSVAEGTLSGSLFQSVSIAGFEMPRLKSLTGEPSMYAVSMLPFWIYFNATSKIRWPVWIIGASLVMSTSSTAFIGFGVYFLIRLSKVRFDLLKVTIAVLVLCVVAFLARNYIADLFQQMIIDKIDQKNVSGAERSDLFHASIELWRNGSIGNQLFGIGFGYVRSTDMLSTMLVNIGLVGTALLSVLLLYPAFRLNWDARGMALRQCCAATWVMMMVSVPEFAYLAPWTFVAVAYARLREQRLEKVLRTQSQGRVHQSRGAVAVKAFDSPR
jgi:hypothetical protein